MRHWSSALVLVLAPLALMVACPGAERDLTREDGAALVTLLGDPALRGRAHYELVRRAEPEEDKGFKAFTANHYAQRIVLCPQGPGRPPITVVLYGFLTHSPDEGAYAADSLADLFPPEPASPGASLLSPAVPEPAIDAYAADGRRLMPFGGDNVLGAGGAFVDVDGDGTIERVDVTSYSVEGVRDVDVLEVQRVRETAEPLLAALINWGARDWSFAVVQPPTGGLPEIRVGPTDAAGALRPRAVFRHDPASGRLGCVGEPPRDHLRLLTPNMEGVFAALKRDGLTFAADPSEPGEEEHADPAAALPALATPLAKPYVFVTTGPDPLAVARFMAEGRNLSDEEDKRRPQTRLPAGFWTMPPRDAALALAELNRTDAHRARYRLAVDARDGQAPPAELGVSLASDSSRCYHDVRTVWHLRSGAQGGDLASAVLHQGGVVFRDPARDQPALDLRLTALEPAVARQVAETIWWLDRVRSLARRVDHGSGGVMSSTADGRALLMVVDGTGVRLVDVADTIWSDAVAERWREGFDREVMLNLAHYLVDEALTARVASVAKAPGGVDHPVAVIADEAGQRRAAAELLRRFDPRQVRSGHALVVRAVQATGQQLWTELVPELERIASALPGELKPLRTAAQVEAERKTLERDPDAHQRVMALYAEDFALEQRNAATPQALAAAIAMARAQFAAANDVPALGDWARSGREGWRWALVRLSIRDRQAYVAALEDLISRNSRGLARSLFAALAAADPARADVLAAKLPAADTGPLVVDAFARLTKAGAIPDEGERVAALLAVVRDVRQGWEMRSKAVDLLVPLADPLRYRSADIDATLVALLQAGPSTAEGTDFTLGRVCRALAQRGRSEQVDPLIDLFARTQDDWTQRAALAAAVAMAQRTGGAPRQRLHDLLVRHLASTNLFIDEIIWAVWALDLRELAPTLEAIATAGPEDIAGPLTNISGGQPRPVAGQRYHFARQVLQLWRERDPATRAVLLLALRYHDPLGWDDPAHQWRRLQDFTALAADPAVRPAVAEWWKAWTAKRIEPMYPATAWRWTEALQLVGITVTAATPAD